LDATGPRSAGAGGALLDTSGSTTDPDLSTPGGALVVRFASGALQALTATAAATSISVSLDVFMRAPVGKAMRNVAKTTRARAGAE